MCFQLTDRQGPLVPIVQLLTSVLSLTILKVDMIMNDLQSEAYRNWHQSSYILNPGVVSNITTLFGEAKSLGPSPATPALFAWAIITWKITAQANQEEQERERLLDLTDASHEPLPPLSALEEPALAITRFDAQDLFDDQPPYHSLAAASDRDGVLRIVNQLVEIALPAFGTEADQVSRDRIRLVFLQLLRASVASDIIGYSPDLIVTTYTVLTGERTFCSWVDERDIHRDADPVVSYFLEDEHVLRPLLLDVASHRYPYEITPLLKFCSALTRGDRAADWIVGMLSNRSQLMQRLPQGFREFALTREEENANWVELTGTLPLFSSGSTSSFRGIRRLAVSASRPSEGLLDIPAGTEGVIVDDSSQPYIAVWQHRHSALSYLVQLLSTYPVGSSKIEVCSQEPAAREAVLETIGLFADLLHSSLQSREGVCSPELCEALGISVDGGQGTVSSILAIFDEELLRLCQEPNNEASLELMVNCTHFLEALVVIAPQKVWPWLARSRLLEGEGSGGTLATVLIGTEMVLGRYDFLIGCIRLYKALVRDAVDRSVARKTPSKALSRFHANTPAESGTSDKAISTILFTFGRTLASIYESSLSWKYTRPEHRPEINTAICDVFTIILQSAHGVDDAATLSAKVTKLVAPIAEYISELYLTKSQNGLPTNPVLASLVIGVGPEDVTVRTSLETLWKRQTRATLTFADVLVRVAILLNKHWTHLEQQIFKATPLLARLYVASDQWTSQVLLLLETLVRGAVRVVVPQDVDMKADSTTAARKNNDQQEPPSLLGHLGPTTAKNFLSVMSQLGGPLGELNVQTNIWKLLSAVVTCKQQWFSLYLLTGSTPRDSMRNNRDAAALSNNKALLTRALDALTRVLQRRGDNMAVCWVPSTALLEFVSSAQNNWSWAMGDLRKRREVILPCLSFLEWMQKNHQKPKRNGEDVDSRERPQANRFTALVCEFLAMYLHSARQVGDITVLKEVVSKLGYLEENALDLPLYNDSLHKNLKQHIETYFPAVKLSNFKRTTLYPASLGGDFFYDVSVADRLLSFDSRWSGPRDDTGFKFDVIKANYNMSLVESQVQLLQGWKTLALELSHVAGKDERVARLLTGVVKKCMRANADSSLPEALFGQLTVLRADLAFALLKKLVEAKVQTPEVRQLLTPVWDALRSSTPDFDNVFATDTVDYHRSLLRILYLALHFHLVEDSDQSEATALRSSFRGTIPTSHNDYTAAISTQLLEILADTVAKGFRSLATQLHADPASVSPSDFALLTALLQRITAIPEMTMWQSQAALLFANNNTIRYATSLFSWSDRLTVYHNGVDDPIYGELSLLFLLSLSSIQALAETMAVDGVLSQLNTANLMNYYRRPNGMGPFDTPARLYSIWVKGILPLCLNLLLSVGPPIAAEISAFLNQYPEQLLRSSLSINSNPSSRYSQSAKITLSIASETHSLALISAIIDNVRKQGPKLGIQANEVNPLEWDKENMKEDVESWLSRKGALRERIVAMDERELEMAGRKGKVEGCSGLEDRVVAELEDAGRCLGLIIGGGN
jgi:nuclear pore complex protein Nup188